MGHLFLYGRDIISFIQEEKSKSKPEQTKPQLNWAYIHLYTCLILTIYVSDNAYRSSNRLLLCKYD